MLWACILLPQLALDGLQRGCDDPDRPLALIAGNAQRRVLQAVNPAARALGLRPGQSLTAARMLASHFATEDYDAARIEHWQAFLAAWAYGFSSQVSLFYPRVVLLEVESSLGLFGPWAQFEARLRQELIQLGFSHRITLAPNPAAARVLANAYESFAVTDGPALRAALDPLPIDRVGLPKEAATALSRMGLRRLGQVLALPRETLARRFPSEVLAHLDCLLGLRPLSLTYYTPPDHFSGRIEFNFDVQAQQALLFPLRRLINDLAAFLAGRDGGVQRFVLHLEHVEGEDTLVPVGLLSTERQAELLFELARGRLEPVRLPGPVRALRLLAQELPAFVPVHGALFDTRPQQNQPWEQLRERIRARLGDNCLLELRANADYRPERALALPGAGPGGHLQLAPPRPGWLLHEPALLAEPALQVLAGPERIESGWWDGSDMRRDYYRVQVRNGQCAWAYRTVGDTGPLWLQGWFA